MKFNNPFIKKLSHCGLDMGTNWVKAVSLRPGGNGAALDKFNRSPYPPEALEKPENTANLLKNFRQASGITDKVVVGSLTGNAVIIKRVNFPVASAKELDQNIRKEARQYIPFDIQDVYLDYQVMGPGNKDNTLDVLLVAGKRKVAQEYTQSLSLAEIGISILDVDVFALSNCFEYNYPELMNSPSYILDIGAMQSIFCVYYMKQPVFFREMGIGGKLLTDNMAKILNRKKSEAEEIKLNGPNQLNEEEKQNVASLIYDTLRGWTAELKRLISFYLNSIPDAEPSERLFLAGGGALLSGITDLFASELSLKCETMDPWRKVQVSPENFDREYLGAVAPQYAVATGLALRTLL